jgi:hypothetical protein
MSEKREVKAPATSRDDALAVQELVYKRVTAERDRLRGARAFFARQLGPLPTFAGVSVALVGAFSDKIKDDEFLWWAFGLFALMVLTSVLYSGMPPYRTLRKRRIEKGMPEGLEGMSPEEWYEAEIALERDIYSPTPGARRNWRWPSWDSGKTLQELHDRERSGVFITQGLFLLVIGALLLAR